MIKQEILDTFLPTIQKINSEVVALKYDDSNYSVRVEFCTGYQYRIPIKGMTDDEVLESIKQYLRN